MAEGFQALYRYGTGLYRFTAENFFARIPGREKAQEAQKSVPLESDGVLTSIFRAQVFDCSQIAKSFA